ncbi:MAG: succinate--CoA ligase subunit beta, partial [Deltaproteobacteria bacterium]|nr:succinate--CoA ligase subunit beta [Deltaproteobacteria bacterium]
DDNALFRQEAVAAMQDVGEEEPSEVEADKAKLTYIRLDGNIGCLVNGAGLAMATMDIIKECGGEPANFLDVGGTATAENVAKSFEIMLRDQVAGIFVNVFGGIVRCDVVAQGLVDALSKVRLEIPLVVRLEGNRKAEAVAILAGSGLPLITASDMLDGARKIVAACSRG